MIFRTHAWLLLLVCAVCPASVSAQIVSPNRIFGRYQAFNWQEQHGVPQSTVLTVATTRDGYIWLGTYEGAARFDGLRFTLFSPTNTEAIGSPMVMALLEDRAGDLWMGTYGGGLTRLSGGRFTRYTARDGLANDYVTRLFEDRNGTLWIGTDGGGVSRWRDGRFTSYGVADGLPGDLIRAIAEDAEGGIWIGTNRGLVHMSGDRFSADDLPAALASTDTAALFMAQDRALWVGASDAASIDLPTSISRRLVRLRDCTRRASSRSSRIARGDCGSALPAPASSVSPPGVSSWARPRMVSRSIAWSPSLREPEMTCGWAPTRAWSA